MPPRVSSVSGNATPLMYSLWFVMGYWSGGGSNDWNPPRPTPMEVEPGVKMNVVRLGHIAFTGVPLAGSLEMIAGPAQPPDQTNNCGRLVLVALKPLPAYVIFNPEIKLAFSKSSTVKPDTPRM